MIRLKPDWRVIIAKAWSVRLVLLAGLLTGGEIILPLYIDDIPRNLFAILSMIASMAALVAKVLAQKEFE